MRLRYILLTGLLAAFAASAPARALVTSGTTTISAYNVVDPSDGYSSGTAFLGVNDNGTAATTSYMHDQSDGYTSIVEHYVIKRPYDSDLTETYEVSVERSADADITAYNGAGADAYAKASNIAVHATDSTQPKSDHDTGTFMDLSGPNDLPQDLWAQTWASTGNVTDTGFANADARVTMYAAR